MENRIRFLDVPAGSWLAGLAFIGAGFYYYTRTGFSFPTWITAGIGLALLLLNRGLTIIADRGERALRLQYWSLFLFRTEKVIPFDDIAGIRIDSTRSGRRPNRRTRSYRIELTLRDNSILPFRTSYSSGAALYKQKIVDELRAFIGLGQSVDESPIGVMRVAAQAAAAQATRDQQALTGPNDELRETNGVRWRVQSSAMGAAPVTRWFSPDFKTRSGFLFLAQKVSGQSSGGIMASLGKLLFGQTLSLYGFTPADTPNLSAAEPLDSLPPLLEEHFTAFTSVPEEARQLLNPWVQNPLAEWGRGHPLKQVQIGQGSSQLVVLFSPNGVYLATLGTLQPGQLEELTRVGVELVKSQ